MWHRPFWNALLFAASQVILRILWNQKFHFHIYKFLPSFPIPSQVGPFYTPTYHFLKIQLNIILQSTIRTPSGLFA